MFDLKWQIEGEKQLVRKMDIVAKGIKNFTPEFKKSTDFIKGFSEKEVFESKGAAIGERWPARRRSYPWSILQKTGKMRKSFKTKVEKMQGTVWNSADYFKYHQSRLPRRRLPRRIMLKLSNQIKDRIVKFFHEGIYNRIKK